MHRFLLSLFFVFFGACDAEVTQSESDGGKGSDNDGSIGSDNDGSIGMPDANQPMVDATSQTPDAMMAPNEGPELLENNDFELADTNNDDFGWKSWNASDERRVEGSGVDLTWGCFIPGAVGPPANNRRTVVEQLGVQVVAGRNYRFSFSMKTDNVSSSSRGNIYWVNAQGETFGSTRIIGATSGTTPWTLYEIEEVAPPEALAFNLHLRVFHPGGGGMPGEAVFDNVSVREVLVP